MYFRKYPNAANFDFVHHIGWKDSTGECEAACFDALNSCAGIRKIQITRQDCEEDVYLLTFSSLEWPHNFSQTDLSLPTSTHRDHGKTELRITDGLHLELRERKNGRVLLQSVRDAAFGICGSASIFQFERTENHQFYGMGEKLLGLELSEKHTKFWNTDVWADFDWPVPAEGRPDPLYVSIPYLIIKQENTYIGILIDNPGATFMSTAGTVNIAGQMEADSQPRSVLTLGAESGQPNLVIIYGPTLAELTRKLQRMVGLTPRPPVWALGYHQCRWGYESMDHLRELNAAMNEHEIPCDGLWLDIGYMNGFRVFTFNNEFYPNPKTDMAEAQQSGRKVVPIIDPGVKAEPGYEVYDSGCDAQAFCLNPQGRNYIGLVWPGETAFPDYSTKRGRDWWSKHVAHFASIGFHGCWIDMNDPSTGHVLNTDMLFDGGKNSHETFHNQYAMGMARATREGFLKANPNERPFVLSRSGSTGSSKYTAIWTGDNASNYHYLKIGVACSMNLALSGVPFNGPDIGGFGGDTTPELIRDWMKAGFLFPFCRNHSIIGSRNQEPWNFDKNTLAILREFIQLRYRLRPYLYNLFVAQSETGEAILRPLFYDFDDNKKLELAYLDDQFMIGPSIMQAPALEENQKERSIVLPHSDWYATADAQWIEGGQTLQVLLKDSTTPLFVRAGAILPMAKNEGSDFGYYPNDIECHIFLRTKSEEPAEYSYVFDDGISFDYENKKQSRLHIAAQVNGDELHITTGLNEDGFGDCAVDFVIYDSFSNVTINGKQATLAEATIRLAGSSQKAYRLLS